MVVHKSDKSAGWWAGDREDFYSVGPEKTKQDAIDEALGVEANAEVELPDGTWKRRVYFAECGGLYFDCCECGIVAKACADCVDYLGPEETGGLFQWSRNEGFADFDYDD